LQQLQLQSHLCKTGTQVKIRAQLIDAETDDHIWSDTYLRDISEVFKVQSEIAQIIAKELFAVITPEEHEIIETIPTTKITAYDYYLQSQYSETTEDALKLLYSAINEDSAFARAYTGLAEVYLSQKYRNNYFETNFLDSINKLANKALKYDPKLDKAYLLKGIFNMENGMMDEALEDFNQAIELNPNGSEALIRRASLMSYQVGDWVSSIKDLFDYVKRNRDNNLPNRLNRLGYNLASMGFVNIAKHYYEESLNLSGDSARYYYYLAWIEFYCNTDLDKAVFYANKAYRVDSSYLAVGYYYALNEQYEEAFEYYKKKARISEEDNWSSLNSTHRIGFSFWMVGEKDIAQKYFDKQIEIGENSIAKGREISGTKEAHYDLAATYAFLGQKDKAYQYLEEFDKVKTYPIWWVTLIKNDPLFESIRNEERFQEIVRNVEKKYQAEHSRVKVWLDEMGYDISTN